MHEITIFSKRKSVSSNQEAMCVWVYILFSRNFIFLSLKTTTHCLIIFLSLMFAYSFLLIEKIL